MFYSPSPGSPFCSAILIRYDVNIYLFSSYVVEHSLKAAHDLKKRFQVIIVDSRPRFEGKTLLTRLLQYGIRCTYVMLNAVSYIMKDVTKVLLGAHAMLSNGQVYSRCGTAMVRSLVHLVVRRLTKLYLNVDWSYGSCL